MEIKKKNTDEANKIISTLMAADPHNTLDDDLPPITTSGGRRENRSGGKVDNSIGAKNVENVKIC